MSARFHWRWTQAAAAGVMFDVCALNARLIEPLSVSFAPPVRACERCGCTEARACPGGCFWIGPTLCSACGRPEKRFEPLKATRVMRQ